MTTNPAAVIPGFLDEREESFSEKPCCSIRISRVTSFAIAIDAHARATHLERISWVSGRLSKAEGVNDESLARTFA